MAAPGGRVLVLPGTYEEALVIGKGLTLEGIGGKSGAVIVGPAGVPLIAVRVTTSDPVTIRDLTVQYSGANGVVGLGAVNLTLDRATIVAVNPPLGQGNLIAVINEPAVSGPRARLVVRESTVDGGISKSISDVPPFAQSFGIHTVGDVDALLAGNKIRRTGAVCIFIQLRLDLTGETNADVIDNDVDECYPLGRAGAILVGPQGGFLPSPLPSALATGVVNVVGNTIRNSERSCLTSTGINYEFLGGRVERNTIVDVVQSCAAVPALFRNLAGGIWVGGRRGLPAARPIIRYNDIVGNAHAGLHVGSSQTTPIDASCNWWGSAGGPSGPGSGSGDAVVVVAGAAPPTVTPFATAAIAATARTC